MNRYVAALLATLNFLCVLALTFFDQVAVLYPLILLALVLLIDSVRAATPLVLVGGVFNFAGVLVGGLMGDTGAIYGAVIGAQLLFVGYVSAALTQPLRLGSNSK